MVVKDHLFCFDYILVRSTYECVFSVSILLLFSLIPSKIMTNSLIALKNIYSYDKFGYVLFVVFVFGYVLFVLKSFDIILNCYNFDTNSRVKKFIKKTTLNYVAFLIAILFLYLL